MKFSSQILYRKIILGLIIVGLSGASLLSAPKRAEAQLAVTDIGLAVQSVLQTISQAATQINTYLSQYKEMILDPLAWIISNQLLEAMTADVVDWVNNGFEGKPAFLVDPAAFFIDQADQITGAFIADSGPLQSLCSPFSIDIRLSLAITQSMYSKNGSPNRKRYSCTLGSIINNVKNIPNNISVNGRSINGFISGDFDQGGWPAFISLTTEQNNNPYALYLNAQADLSAQIAGQSAATNADLNRGGGFLSYTKCDNQAVGGLTNPVWSNELNADSVNYTGAQWSSTLGTTQAPTTQKVCHTETPGSVISGALNKHLGLGADKAAAADEFSEILTSLFAKFMTNVLTKGLASASSHGSGQTASIVDSLRKDRVSTQKISAQILSSVVKNQALMGEFKSAYDQAFADVSSGKVQFDNALQVCLANNNSVAGTVRNQLDTQVMPSYNNYSDKAKDADSRWNLLSQIILAAQTNASADDLVEANNTYAQLIMAGGLVTAADVAAAKKDAAKAATDAQNMRADAQHFQNMCSY